MRFRRVLISVLAIVVAIAAWTSQSPRSAGLGIQGNKITKLDDK